MLQRNAIKVLIVDDSRTIRDLFTQFLSEAPGIEVVGSAEHPHEARQLIKQLNPDVVTLDIEMPQMDGLSFLEKIMTLRPMPVVMVSTLTQRGAEATIRALELGAVDFVAKPTDLSALARIREELIAKVRHAATAKVSAKVPAARANHLSFTGNASRWLIAIGASTGGVEALRELLTSMPANGPPTIITQHMPSGFTSSFAERLNQAVAATVKEARHGEPLKAGHVYIAAGSHHLQLMERPDKLVCQLDAGPTVSGHKPSVDVMFRSAAMIRSRALIGVILTGMGRDGAEGLKSMREAGAHTLGQTEASCVVYGMPKVAHALGAVQQELPLSKMASAIVSIANS